MENDLNITIDEMLALKDEIAVCKFNLNQLEQKEELLSIKLANHLRKMQVDEIVLPNCYFGVKKTYRTTFNQKLFSTECPELFEKYKTTKESEKFEFKIGQKK